MDITRNAQDEDALARAVLEVADLLATAASFDELLLGLDAEVGSTSGEETILRVTGRPWLRSATAWRWNQKVEGLVLTLHEAISAGALEPYFGQLHEFQGEFGDPWSAVGSYLDRGGAFTVSLELVVGSWRGGPVSSMRGREVVLRRAPKP